MKVFLYALGVIGFLIALTWFVFPIAYMERCKPDVPFLVLIFAAVGYYGYGVFMYRTYKDRVI